MHVCSNVFPCRRHHLPREIILNKVEQECFFSGEKSFFGCLHFADGGKKSAPFGKRERGEATKTKTGFVQKKSLKTF